MNSLSWTIYIIGLLSPITTVLILATFGCSVWFILSFFKLEPFVDRWGDKDFRVFLREKASKLALFLAITFLVLSIVIPNKQTFVLIAASEFGERLITDERVTSIVDPSVTLLREWIKKETAAITAVTRPTPKP